MRKILILFFVFIELSCWAKDTESSLKASFIYYFIQYVEWQNEDSINQYQIGVYSPNHKLYGELVQLASSKTVKNKKISIIYINSVSEINQINVLYVAPEFNEQVPQILKLINNKQILLITDSYPNKTEVMINFINKEGENKISFETNKQILKSQGFNYKNELLIYGGSQVEVKELLNEGEQRLQNTLQQIRQHEEQIQIQQIALSDKNKQVSLLEKKLVYTDSLLRMQQKLYEDLNFQIYDKQAILDLRNQELERQKQDKIKIIGEIEIKKAELSNALDSLKKLEVQVMIKQNEIKEKNLVLLDKEQRIEKQKNQLFFIIIILSSVMIVMILYIRLYRLKRNLNLKLEEKVIERTQQLTLSELHFSNLFKNTPIPTLEYDMTNVLNFIKSKNFANTDEFDDFFKDQQNVVDCLEKLIIKDINRETLELFKTDSAESFSMTYLQIHNTLSQRKILDVLKKIWQGETKIEYEANRFTSTGENLYLIIRWVLIDNPDAKERNVIITFTDITRMKTYEKELQNHQNNLEKLVEDRTEEILLLNKKLSSANEELKLSNDQLTEKKDALEQALTTIKDTQESLIQSEKLASLGMLTAGIAHEINNPINFISGSQQLIELLIEDLKDNTGNSKISGEELLLQLQLINQSIATGVDRTTEIIHSLKNYISDESERFIEGNVIDIMKNALLILRNSYKDRIEIIENYSQIPIIECVPGKIYQVFVNLLSNAIDAIEGHGKIEISVSFIDKENNVQIRIKDNGLGIDNDHLTRIFDPFFTTKEVGKGTGLGLYIVYGIIQNHQGNIMVDSELNNGTSFTITLPIKQLA